MWCMGPNRSQRKLLLGVGGPFIHHGLGLLDNLPDPSRDAVTVFVVEFAEYHGVVGQGFHGALQQRHIWQLDRWSIVIPKHLQGMRFELSLSAGARNKNAVQLF